LASRSFTNSESTGSVMLPARIATISLGLIG